MKSALILFAKPPLPGRVKTRLVPPLTPKQAAEVYEAFLRDVVAAPRDPRSPAGESSPAMESSPAKGSSPAKESSATKESSPTKELHVEPPFDAAALAELAGPTWAIREQVGPSLGTRLVHAFDDAFARGFERVVVRNTDSPDLPPEREREAFAAMDVDPVTGAPGVACVLGPDTGGGYYLVGLRRRCWEMFLDLPMSVSTNFERTLERARERFERVTVLAMESDVDHMQDLRQLAARLVSDPASADRCPATRRAVLGLITGDLRNPVSLRSAEGGRAGQEP